MFQWRSVNQAFFAKKLIDRSVSFETSISYNVLVVELKNKKRLFLSYPEALQDDLLNYFNSACENLFYEAEEHEISWFMQLIFNVTD